MMKFENSFMFFGLLIAQRLSKYEIKKNEKGYLLNNRPLSDLTISIKEFSQLSNEKESLLWENKLEDKEILEEKPNLIFKKKQKENLSETDFIEILTVSFERILRNKSFDKTSNYALFNELLNLANQYVVNPLS
jgi:hypothetical protein